MPTPERAKRVRTIRHRVAAAAVSIFIAAFAGITVQLASGNDPALKTSTTVSQPATTTDTTTTSTADTTQSAEQTTRLAPVTTSQS
jgi:hypothetical protein